VIPGKLHETVRIAIGLFVAVYGMQMALGTRNPLILLLSLVLGAVIGELLRLDDGVQAVGRWTERRTSRGDQPGRVSLAFVTTSLLFCVGPLTIIGTFLDGARGDVTVLAVKSTLDGFSSIVFAATLGWGVALSAATVLVVQGTLTLAAFVLHAGLGPRETSELTAVGGVAVIAIALGLLQLKTIRVANLLPGLVVAPVLVAISHALQLS
jgi:uncharacterized membrane protein YqgA involved in biofilm formation